MWPSVSFSISVIIFIVYLHMLASNNRLYDAEEEHRKEGERLDAGIVSRKEQETGMDYVCL